MDTADGSDDGVHSMDIILVFRPGRFIRLEAVARKARGYEIEDNWTWDEISLAWNQLVFLDDRIDGAEERFMMMLNEELDNQYPGWQMVDRDATFLPYYTIDPMTIKTLKRFSYCSYDYVYQVLTFVPGTPDIRLMMDWENAYLGNYRKYTLMLFPEVHLHPFYVTSESYDTIAFDGDLAVGAVGPNTDTYPKAITFIHCTGVANHPDDALIEILTMLEESRPSVALIVECTAKFGEANPRILEMGYNVRYQHDTEVAEVSTWLIWSPEDVRLQEQTQEAPMGMHVLLSAVEVVGSPSL